MFAGPSAVEMGRGIAMKCSAALLNG
jgi:hypothetical protein